MKKKYWASGILSIFISILISILISIFMLFFPKEKWVSLYSFFLRLIDFISNEILLLFAFIFLIILTFLYAKYYTMVVEGGYNGLFGGRSLRKKINKTYQNSTMIKIKVTRGFNLFGRKSGIFYNLFFKKEFNSNKKVKILLHYPCIKSEHIKNRSRANQLKVRVYIENIFTVLKELKHHTESPHTDEKIEVRFYRDKYVNWRCYIFSNSSELMNCFYTGYSTKISGAKSKMLSMIGKNASFCNYINDEFDYIFDHDSFELVNNTIGVNELLNTDICGDPACQALMKESYKKIFKGTS